MPALAQAREALMALRTLAVDAPATSSRGVNRWPDVLALVDAAQDALTRLAPDKPRPVLTVAQAERLLALITDAQLDGNIHGQAPEQRDRLAHAKALVASAAAAARLADRRAETGRPVTPALPELAVLHVRDPDGYCEVRLFADGTALDCGVESVDAGAGHDAEEWADRIAAAEADPPSDWRDAVVAALNNPPGADDHITGWDEIDAHLEEARARRDRATQQAHR